MAPRILLDTHVVIRWVADFKRLSRAQSQYLEKAVRREESVGVSTLTLLEIAILVSAGKLGPKVELRALLGEIEGNPIFRLFPMSFQIANEIGGLGSLRDPVDQAIVATARVHRLHLMTSDQRIVESKLVAVID
jgi:PIN domain nuclease of toxin-antitoxin system